MPNVKANGIQIEYENFGDKSSPALIFIMGEGVQMAGRHKEFCRQLSEKGLFGIAFDNRDVGFSQKFEEAGVPDVMEMITAFLQGQEIQAPYTLDDMADDVIGLMDALEIDKAHICGVSMGAAITQIIGYRHPSRVLSLTSMNGSTGNPDLPMPKPEVLEVLLKPVPESVSKEEYVERAIEFGQVIWGSYPFEKEMVVETAVQEFERVYYPQGMTRHVVASLANGNRKPRLSQITAPTLIIHGAENPVVSVEAAKEMAEEIPGAKLLIIEKMGAFPPTQVRPQIIDAIAEHARKATNRTKVKG